MRSSVKVLFSYNMDNEYLSLFADTPLIIFMLVISWGYLKLFQAFVIEIWFSLYAVAGLVFGAIEPR